MGSMFSYLFVTWTLLPGYVDIVLIGIERESCHIFWFAITFYHSCSMEIKFLFIGEHLTLFGPGYFGVGKDRGDSAPPPPPPPNNSWSSYGFTMKLSGSEI